ncbi:hypothetical protein B0920_24780 [Massilia sp. KIM]|uniref:hypothetical protein n=1 Tax=Massilia sp. KIM TaxID=1955422 RepID=UPI0009902DCB|nr:hypothetical protein [Massilia sp. KIM]OON59137.1 hypothetical protein B0920_24780 [Massilia sp. KIM]
MQDEPSLTRGRRSAAPERMRQGPRFQQQSAPGADPAPPVDAPGDPLCRDTAYAGLVTAVRSAVERNAGFGA